MENATFFNFDDKPFTGYWNGKPKTFKPGEKVYMPAYLAEHFAKHLTNRYLIENGKETYTSPKFPAQVPIFMEVFNRAFIPDIAGKDMNELEEEIASVQKGPSLNIDVAERKVTDHGPAAAQAQAASKAPVQELEIENVGPGREPQVIQPPAGDDDESNFETGNK